MEFNDTQRLQALTDYRVLDTAPEQAFDNITELTAKIFRTPISLVSLVDENRQWFKSRFGLKAAELPRAHAFCDHTIRSDATLVVPDATKDPRFQHNPLVTGELGFRFYCGVPLRAGDGQRLGTLCVIDCVPRTISASQVELLEALGRQVEIELELRRRLSMLVEAFKQSSEQLRSQRLLVSMVVHDLRSPLTAMTMLTSLIRTADSESRTALADLLGEAERMRRLLTDVLDVCLHEFGQMRLRRSLFTMQPLLQHVQNRMQRLAATRHQTVALDFYFARVVVLWARRVFSRIARRRCSVPRFASTQSRPQCQSDRAGTNLVDAYRRRGHRESAAIEHARQCRSAQSRRRGQCVRNRVLDASAGGNLGGLLARSALEIGR